MLTIRQFQRYRGVLDSAMTLECGRCGSLKRYTAKPGAPVRRTSEYGAGDVSVFARPAIGLVNAATAVATGAKVRAGEGG